MEHYTLLRHLLSTIAYRLKKTLTGIDATFYSFENRNGVRTPIQIIHHMSNVMTFCLAKVEGTNRGALEELGIDDEVIRFYSLLRQSIVRC